MQVLQAPMSFALFCEALCTRDLELATNVTVGALLSYSLKAWIFKAT